MQNQGQNCHIEKKLDIINLDFKKGLHKKTNFMLACSKLDKSIKDLKSDSAEFLGVSHPLLQWFYLQRSL